MVGVTFKNTTGTFRFDNFPNLSHFSLLVMFFIIIFTLSKSKGMVGSFDINVAKAI